jgi:hypothetical protein
MEDARNKADAQCGIMLAIATRNEKTARSHLELLLRIGLDTKEAVKKWSNAENILTNNRRMWSNAYMSALSKTNQSRAV